VSLFLGARKALRRAVRYATTNFKPRQPIQESLVLTVSGLIQVGRPERFMAINPQSRLILGDCLDEMHVLQDKSVDMILCDLPYGTTAIEWDRQIPFLPLWSHYKRIIKDNGAIVLFSGQPFTTDLISSNREMFRYEIIWKKTQPSGFLNANKAPLRNHENIVVFYKKSPTYNPIKSRVARHDLGRIRHQKQNRAQQYGNISTYSWVETGERYPTSVIEFSNWNGAIFGKNRDATKHPTQKPVDLCKYLVLTYTNPGDLVLDNCMGSGTTGVACIQTERRFIGIEINPEYFTIAENRIKEAKMQPNLLSEFSEQNDFFND
jgi:site-specific DNA-methyltransferase (adenine-specific)